MFSHAIRRRLLALALCAGANVHAFTIAPTAVMFEGSAPMPVQVRVTASPSAPLALEFSVVERRADGMDERLLPTAAAIEVQPPQVLIAAGESASVTVRWQGEHSPVSRSFFLVADELPVTFAETNAQQNLRFLARVHLPVHIADGGKPDLKIQLVTTDGTKALGITNRGSRYARLSDWSLRVASTSNGTTRTIPGGGLAQAAQVDAVLPNRTVVLPADELGLEAQETIFEMVEQE